MNASKSTRCLFCKLLPSPKPSVTKPRHRKFHTTPITPAANRKPAYPNVKAVDLGLMQEAVHKASQTLRPYTPREKQLLALKYTPAQLKAIEAGEAAIDPKDVVRGRWRSDPFAVNYLDDFAQIKPLIDRPVRAPDQDIDPEIRVLDEDEIESKFANWAEEVAQKASEFEARQQSYATEEDEARDLEQKAQEAGVYPGDGLTVEQRAERLRKFTEFGEGPDEIASWERFVSDPNNFAYSPKGTLNYQSDSLAPAIPKFTQPGVEFRGEEVDPHMERLQKQTGMDLQEIRRIRVKNLVCHRVVNQTRMGKIQSMYFLTIAGNENGMLGIGEGKAAEGEDGSRQARMAAIRNMKPIPRYEGRTIYGEVEGKVGASVVQLSNRPPGFGNRCQHLIYEMARAAGLSDLSARCVRSRNPMNVVKATYQALMSQRLPEDVARARGRKLVDVRKVYYEGQVY